LNDAELRGVARVFGGSSVLSFNGGNAGAILPKELYTGFSDLLEPLSADSAVDLPVFLPLPRTGSSVLWDVLGGCVGMDARTSDGGQYVGDVKASALSGRQVLFAPSLPSASSALSQSPSLGRAFLLLRHPVKRLVSSFHDARARSSDPSDPIHSMTTVEYAGSDMFVDNEVVRMLSGAVEGENVHMGHVEIAVEALRTKVLVGISEFLDESLVRFEQYFGWWDAVLERTSNLATSGVGAAGQGSSVLQCQRDRIAAGDRRGEVAQPKPGNEEFRELVRLNWADVQLYHAAKKAFGEQAALVD